MDWKKLFQASEAEETEPPEPDYPLVGEGAFYDACNCKIRVVASEEWEWGQLTIDFCETTERPPPVHFLTYELDAVGQLGDVLDLGMETQTFLLENGIAPGQPFYIDLEYQSYQDWESGHWESEVSWDLADGGVRRLDPAVAAQAWEAFIGRQYTLVGCP